MDDYLKELRGSTVALSLSLSGNFVEDAEELEELEDGLRVSHRKSREDMGKGRN